MSSTTADYEALGRKHAERHRKPVQLDEIRKLIGEQSAESYLRGFQSIPVQHDVYVDVIDLRANHYLAACNQCPRTHEGTQAEVLDWKELHQNNSIAEVRAYWESH